VKLTGRSRHPAGAGDSGESVLLRNPHLADGF
jgi:hypothetical protein